MSKKVKEFIHSRIFIIILIGTLMFTTVLVGTYAWFTWGSTDNTVFTMSIGKLANVTFTYGNAIDGELAPVFNYSDGLSTTFTINNESTSNGGFNIDFNITSIDPELVENSEDIKYAVTKNDELISEGTLSSADNNVSINLYKGNLDIGVASYKIYFYIDANVENDVSMMNKSISGNIMVNEVTGVNFVEYLSNLYADADKAQVTNNSINYNYATSVSLMNDGFGYGLYDLWEESGAPFTTSEDCNDFFDIDTLIKNEACADKTECETMILMLLSQLGVPSVDAFCESSVMNGNIRYYGANPNNYIDIGDTYQASYKNWVEPAIDIGVPTENIPTTESGCKEFVQCSNLVTGGFFTTELQCESQKPYLIQQYGFSSDDELCSITPTVNNFKKNKFLMTILGIEDEATCHSFFDCDSNYEALGVLYDTTFGDASTCKNAIDYTSTDEVCGKITKKVGDPKLYRIIGLFKDVELADGTKKDLVKVMSEDSIGDFAWDLDYESQNTDNNWHDATLQNALNSGYLSSSSEFSHAYVDLLTENIVSDNADFSKIGLSSVQDKIESVVWNLGGYNDSAIYSNQLYLYERQASKCTDCTYETTWTGKVALAYPSDHGYAADFNSCSNTLDGYLSCNSVNWISSLHNGNAVEFLLTPGTTGGETVFGIEMIGLFGEIPTYFGLGVRPVFYLDAELLLMSGDGSQENPYVVE